MTAPKRIALIANPVAGGASLDSSWGEVRDEVLSRLNGAEEYRTTKVGDATRFAKNISEQDFDLLVIAGGDGTLNEVVNGLFDDKGEVINPKLKLALLNTGRGCDFARSLGIVGKHRESLEVVLEPQFKTVDVGKAVFKDEFGRGQSRYFVNGASIGFSAFVAKKVNSTPRLIPSRIAYFGWAASGFLQAGGQKMRITVDGKVVNDRKCLAAFVCNGGYSGSGMHWSTKFKLDDGQFNLVVVEDLPKFRILVSGHRLYDGTFEDLPGISSYKGKKISIESRDDVYLEMDGEQPGLAPVTFEVLPQKLTFAVKRR